jgi:hypothetical protein
MIEVLNLGAGVQSSTVLLMSVCGDLPHIDHAIFADTQWEPQAVYRWLEWLTPIAELAGICVHRVTKGRIRDDMLRSMVRGKVADGVRHVSMPLYTQNKDGTQGLIRRQCTKEYKIEPIERHLTQKILGLQPKGRLPKEPIVRRWYGISYDERQRARTADADGNWCTNWYPLIERYVTRLMCLDWMQAHGYPEPPRSACIGCPFHSNAEWRRLTDRSPEEFADAVEFDKAIRHCGGMRGDVFVHRDMVPLDEVDLRTYVDRGQLLLFDDFRDECSGMCGV